MLFFNVNDNEIVIFDAFQIMHRTLCYSNNLFFFNWKNKLKKGLISYFKTSGITFLRKHVDTNLLVVSKQIGREEEIWRDNMLRKEQMYLIFPYVIFYF